MRRFIVRCILFLLPVVFILGCMEFLIRQVPNTYRQKYQWMSQHGQDVHTLILGNSHGLFGIKPDLLRVPAYNLCNVSQVFEYDDWLLRHFAPSCKNLRTVVLIVDNSNLFDPPLEESESFRCTYYRLYMDYPKHSLFSKYGFELSQMAATMEKVKCWLNGESDMCDSLGWNRNYRVDARDSLNLTDEVARMAAKRHNAPGMKYAKSNREALFRVAEFCQDNHLRLILMQTPVKVAYSQAVQAPYKSFLQQTLQDCRNKYGAEIADYSADVRFTDEDFYDADHLSNVGAEKFTRIIANK